MPATYNLGGPESKMGQHWAPPPSTFIPFNRVLIYGTYNGSVTFIEPMVTLTHLQNGGSSQPFLQPQKFALAGNYPTTYSAYKDDKESYQISLGDFVAQPAN